MSAFGGNVLQNYFEGVARAILIQDQTKMSNVDSPHRPIGFDYCAIAMRQEAIRPLSLRAVEKLDQGQEPESSGSDTGYRRGLLKLAFNARGATFGWPLKYVK
jgi:hypothetical protein